MLQSRQSGCHRLITVLSPSNCATTQFFRVLNSTRVMIVSHTESWSSKPQTLTPCRWIYGMQTLCYLCKLLRSVGWNCFNNRTQVASGACCNILWRATKGSHKWTLNCTLWREPWKFMHLAEYRSQNPCNNQHHPAIATHIASVIQTRLLVSQATWIYADAPPCIQGTIIAPNRVVGLRVDSRKIVDMPYIVDQAVKSMLNNEIAISATLCDDQRSSWHTPCSLRTDYVGNARVDFAAIYHTN